MPVITLQNLGQRRVEVPPDKSILAGVQEAGLDWMHACGGKGRCTTCRLLIVSLEGTLSPLTPAEEGYRQAGRLEPSARLACQTRLIDGHLCVRIPADAQLPHLEYTD